MRTVREGNAFYEIDEECVRRRGEKKENDRSSARTHRIGGLGGGRQEIRRGQK